MQTLSFTSYLGEDSMKIYYVELDENGDLSSNILIPKPSTTLDGETFSWTTNGNDLEIIKYDASREHSVQYILPGAHKVEKFINIDNCKYILVTF